MSFRRFATVAALTIAGLLAAVGIGLLANSISGDNVGLSAKPLSAGRDARAQHRRSGEGPGEAARGGAPARPQAPGGRPPARPGRAATPTTTTQAPTAPPPTTTFDDHGGGSGSGDDNSGKGSSGSGGGSSHSGGSDDD